MKNASSRAITIVTERPNSFIVQLLLEHYAKSNVYITVWDANHLDTVQLQGKKQGELILLLGINKPRTIQIAEAVEAKRLVLVSDVDSLSNEDVRFWLSKGISSIISLKATLQEVDELFKSTEALPPVYCQHLKEKLIQSLFAMQKVNKSSGFSDIEMKILETSKQGYRIKEAAEILGLSPNTIASYRVKMVKKAGVSSFNKLINQIYGEDKNISGTIH